MFLIDAQVAGAMPPLALNLWVGDKLQKLLDPLARGSRPLPKAVKLSLAMAALGGLLLAYSGRSSSAGADGV